MKKFQKENFILIAAIFLLLGGGLFYLKKDQIPVMIPTINQKKTEKTLMGDWILQAVVDEESFTIKNRYQKDKAPQIMNIKKEKKQQVRITNLLLNKSYEGTFLSVKEGLESEKFSDLEKKVDTLIKSFQSNLYADFNHSLFIETTKDRAFLVFDAKKDFLFWLEGEELQILKREN